MAFKPGIDPNTTTVNAPTGTADRTRLVSPFVPIGGTTVTAAGSTKPVLPASAGIFGGSQAEHTKSAEIRERAEGKARQLERFNPPTLIVGPLVAPLFELDAPLPVGDMPAHAAARFSAAARRGRVL